MAKQINNPYPRELLTNRHFKQTSFVLEMKVWRLFFNDEQIKLAMAEALNKAVVTTKIRIEGYFITSWRIYLILNATEAQSDIFIYNMVSYTNHLIKQQRERYIHEKGFDQDFEMDAKLFNKIQFDEYRLKKMLLADPVIIKSYEKDLLELNDFLRNYNFCSVQDYHNCKGPVFVNSTNDFVRTYGVNLSIIKNRYFENHLDFAITEVTKGCNEDPHFRRNWRLICMKGWIGGGYHIFDPKENIIEQALRYTSLMNFKSKRHLPPIVKIDHKHWHSLTDELRLEAKILDFLVLLEEYANRKPIIYTNRNTANLHLNLPIFGEYPIWIIDNFNVEQPKLPEVWKDYGWVFWQHRVNTEIADSENDVQLFNGSLSQLKTFLKRD